jgi:nucleoside-diphosphate-sugar epimerase
VYGGGEGTVGDLFKSAANGLIRVVGDGNNRWPLIYDRDLSELYTRLVAREDASGVYHATDEGDERVNDIVSAIAPYLPVRPDVRHVPLDEARAKIGAYADALALDQVIRSPRARSLGWTPSLRSVVSNAARLLEEWRAFRNQAA